MPASISDDALCSSAYLAFRWVPIPGVGWSSFGAPEQPVAAPFGRRSVSSAGDVIRELERIVGHAFDGAHPGLLLSGGIDSAILAALVPRGTPTFTIRFDSDAVLDESGRASIYARRFGHPHETVTLAWRDVEARLPALMRHKRAPLHAVEAGLSLAAERASKQGIDSLLVGNGADSTFGGLDRLLSRDWTFSEFVTRYTFLSPSVALRDPVGVQDVFESYRRADGIDVDRFLKTVHGDGITQAFTSAIAMGGCRMIAPYEELVLGTELDLARIRSGESKYILREVFARLYPDLPAPAKVAFARPMDVWLADWRGPRSREFRRDADVGNMTGEQRWLLYCLDRFLAMRG